LLSAAGAFTGGRLYQADKTAGGGTGGTEKLPAPKTYGGCKMAKRLSIDDRIDALAKLRRGPSTPEAIQAVKAGLTDKSNLVVAKAATVARELSMTMLTADLVAAFNRFIDDPSQDKGCAALTAAVQALQTFGASEAEVYLRGIHHVQMEASYGGSIDAAIGVRCESAFGLVRMGYRDVMWELAALLADPEKECRLAAVRAIGHSEADAGLPLLKYKVLSGARDSDVAAECFSSLAQINPAKVIPFLGEHLDSPDIMIAEAAGLALGSTRRPAAFALLRERWDRRVSPASREVLLLAIATLRIEPAIEFLISVIATADPRTAGEAVKALALYRRDDAVRSRVAEAVTAKSDPVVSRVFESEFR
jgi:HEAT repeat protein